MSVDTPHSPPQEDTRKAVTGVASLSTCWADNPASGQGVINLSDVRDSARKSVNAVLSRGRNPIDIDGTAASEGSRSRNSRASTAALQLDDLARVARLSHGGMEDKFADGLLNRQRSRFAGEEVAQAAKLPQNARVVERIVAAPLPCTLLATSDTLGRIFVQDSRDLCVLRVLKGYRDAQIAWLAQGGPLLAILAPRLNVLELHGPLEVKRIAAFRLLPGSMLVQSTSHHVFCISPDGKVYELMRTMKGQAETTVEDHAATLNRDEAKIAATSIREAGNFDETVNGNVSSNGTAADYESVGAFLEAVRSNKCCS